ncbi:hypothetical protein Aple_014160 [Acrocarpospora pleiomorpha]|uniref:Uncharacterized protein n=1 Tax=Acrocarpospora pleiomorpha TaxID=90975 RepID=A0A5M3XFZ9_9ACTN|nr:hypothetical protein [Acrocarpospora pleiomorpha]GES18521.1 hypothetical protein Aple_014160 [Acrocarpospora pleiomorpha]
MPIELDSRFVEELTHLLDEEDWGIDSGLMYADPWDQFPIYSRYSQLEFLAALPIEECNRVLIRAAMSRFIKVVECSLEYYGKGEYNYDCMMVVRDFMQVGEKGFVVADGHRDLLTPHLWWAHPSDPRMSKFRLYEARSKQTQFVAAALDDRVIAQLDGGCLLKSSKNWMTVEPRTEGRCGTASPGGH